MTDFILEAAAAVLGVAAIRGSATPRTSKHTYGRRAAGAPEPGRANSGRRRRGGPSGPSEKTPRLSTGALAARFGWGVLLTAAFTAFALAACYGLGLLVAGRASVRRSSVPFGPFLIAGCLTVVLLARG
jgi:hypothetical protein